MSGPWLTRQRSRTRVALLVTATILVSAVFVGLVSASFDHYDRDVTRTSGASRAAAQMLTAMLEEETGLRGYMNTGDRRFLEPYGAGRRRFTGAVDQARRSAAQGTPLEASLREQVRVAERWRRLADVVIAMVARERSAVTPRLSEALRRKREMDRFRRENARFQAVLEREGSQRRTTARTHGIAILVGVALLLAAGFGAAVRVAGRRERRSDARLRALVHNSLDLLTVMDPETRVLYTSPAVERMLGHAPGELLGRPLGDLLHPDDAPRVLATYARSVSVPGVSDEPAVCRLRHADGTYRWLENARNNLLHDPDIGGVVLNSRDVTEREQLAVALRRQAFTDRLTGLANRAMLEDRLAQATERPPSEGQGGCVVLLDLDDFKLVNDSLGHLAGDRLLVEVAQRLAAVVRSDDTLARVGGDEFAILIEHGDAERTGASLADRCLEALREPMRIEGRALTVTPSIGVAPVPYGGTVEDVMRNADLALYKAKHDGKSRVAAYADDLHATALERLELDNELRRAVELDELVLHFQPVFAAATNRLVGFEALVRWMHPRHGLVGPGAFIEAAERNGAIVDIGRWVLREACRQAATWQQTYHERLTMAVNLSSVQFEDPSLVADVDETLRTYGLDAATIILEITETAIMRDFDATRRTLCALKALGVKIALDDFGTGYSSLGRLKDLPLDELKIPKPFVDGIAVRDEDLSVARGIVDLAHGMRLGVVAEGIEHADQLDRLRSIGCDLAQGFHLARPATAEHLEANTLVTPTVT